MTNHYHLDVEAADAAPSQGMRKLSGVYTQNTNRRHGLVGHLFQGRFKAILVGSRSGVTAWSAHGAGSHMERGPGSGLTCHANKAVLSSTVCNVRPDPGDVTPVMDLTPVMDS